MYTISPRRGVVKTRVRGDTCSVMCVPEKENNNPVKHRGSREKDRNKDSYFFVFYRNANTLLNNIKQHYIICIVKTLCHGAR